MLKAKETTVEREVRSPPYMKSALLLILWHVLRIVFPVVRMSLHQITFTVSYLGSLITSLLPRFYCKETVHLYRTTPADQRCNMWPWQVFFFSS
jgi:hypothetical protein